MGDSFRRTSDSVENRARYDRLKRAKIRRRVRRERQSYMDSRVLEVMS